MSRTVDDDAGVATSGGGQCALGAAKIEAESRLWLVAVAELEQKSRWGALQIKLFNDIERTHINS